MICPNKGCLVQKRLFPTVLKMPKPQGSGLHHEGNSRRDLWEPFRVTFASTQVDLGKILLAYHAKGCLNLCQSLQQMLEVQQHH